MATDNGNDLAARVKALQDRVAARAKGNAGSADKTPAPTPVQLFLPGLEEFMRAMPNPVDRSSLFAPIARGKKKMHAGTVLVSRADSHLEYWGVQLNELHADITMQLLFEAQGMPLGQPVTINRKAFMRAIGWGGSGREYERFHRCMLELTGGMLVIEAKKPDGRLKYSIGRTQTFRIVDRFECDEGGENYTYILDPRWVKLFGRREYTLIDWEKRLQISAGQDLAKSLQRLFATSNESPQRYALEYLKDRAQYESPMRKFKTYLGAAMCELERLEIVATWKIECSTKGMEQLTVWINASA